MENFTFTQKDGVPNLIETSHSKDEIIKQVTENVKEEVKKKEDAISFSDKSTDFILKHIAKEKDPENPDRNPDKEYVLSHLLHGRIKALPIKEQVQLMKNTANEVSIDPKFESAYTMVEDYVLHNLLNSFIETAYRYHQTDPYKRPDDCADFKQIHNLISTLSSSQLKTLDRINNEYSSKVSSNAAEFSDYRLAYTSIQATVDKAITDATTLDATVYQDTSDNLSKTSHQQQLVDAQNNANTPTNQPVQQAPTEEQATEESITETITDAVVTIIVSNEFSDLMEEDPTIGEITNEYINEIEEETGKTCVVEIEDEMVEDYYNIPDHIEKDLYTGTSEHDESEYDNDLVMTFTKNDTSSN